MKNRGLYVADWGYRAARRLCLAVLAAGTVLPAVAGDASVEAVQWPAWVVRDGRQIPVQAGADLQARDRLLTGRNARLLIRLADGSAVKVGEQADVVLASIERKEDALQAAIEVGKGAFRFTTGLFAKVLGKREVKVRVSTLTIGIRGTDVWGKSTEADDLVLLLEGKVSVSQDAGPEQELATPLEYLLAPRGRSAERKSAPAAQVGEWAKETEIDAKRPAGRAGGRHAASIAEVETEAEALKLRSALLEEGYPVRLRPLDGGRYALRLERIGSAKEAAALAAEARSKLKSP